jgi:NB-ARC domain
VLWRTLASSSEPSKIHSQVHFKASNMHKRTLQVPFEDDSQGCQWLASDLQTSKVLLVVDDVWRREDLRLLDFATAHDCCHQDSTLIVTTRDRRVLHDEQGYELDGLQITQPGALNDENAALLLCHHAFGSGHAPPAEFEGVVRGLVAECKGLPLALQTLGASVRGKGAGRWQELIERLQRVDLTLSQTQQIMARCKPSYDVLPPHLQQCFVDFAAYRKPPKTTESLLAATKFRSKDDPPKVSSETKSTALHPTWRRCLSSVSIANTTHARVTKSFVKKRYG